MKYRINADWQFYLFCLVGFIFLCSCTYSQVEKFPSVVSRNWVEEVRNKAKSPVWMAKNDFATSIFDGDMILSDHPFNPLQAVFYSQTVQEIDWKAIPMPYRGYIQGYFRENDLEKAIHHLKIAAEKFPHNLQIPLLQAIFEEKLGKNSDALLSLIRILNMPIDPEIKNFVYRMRIRIFCRQANWGDCLNLLREYKSLLENKEFGSFNGIEKEILKVRNYMGICQYLDSSFETAFEEFEKLAEENPGVFAFAWNKNKIYLEKKRYETTLKHLNDLMISLERIFSFFTLEVRTAIEKGELDRAEKISVNRDYFSFLLAMTKVRKGEILFREKLYGYALEVYSQSLSKDPLNPICWYRKGEIHFELKQNEKALQAFRKSAQNAKSEDVLKKEALKKVDQILTEISILAVEQSDKLLRKKDEFFQNLSVEDREKLLLVRDELSLAHRWLRAGKHRELIERLLPWVKERPDIMDFPYLIAVCYRELGRVQQARFWYQKALELNPAHLPSMAGLHHFDCIAGDFESAREWIGKMKNIDDQSHYLDSALGWYFFHHSRWSKSLHYYQKAIEKEPGNGEYHYRQGMVFFRAGLDRFALHKFEDARTAGYLYARTYLFEGLAYLNLGESQKGEISLGKATKYGQDNPELTEFARQVLKNLSRFGRVNQIRDLREDSLVYQSFMLRRESRGVLDESLHLVSKGKTLEGIFKIEEALKKDEKNLELMNALGFLNLLVEKENEARKWFEKILLKNPYDFRAMNSLSELEFNLGRIDQVLIYWEQLKGISSLIRHSFDLDMIADSFLRYLEVNVSDPWACYWYARTRLHQRREEEALVFLEKVLPVFYKDQSDLARKLKILHGQLRYKVGVLKNDSAYRLKGRAALMDAGYSYIDILDRYPQGILSLFPAEKKENIKEIELDLSQIDGFSKTVHKKVVEGLPKWPYKPSGVMQHPSWTRVDVLLSKNEPKRVLSSYDQFLKERQSVEDRYLKSSPNFGVQTVQEDFSEMRLKKSEEFRSLAFSHLREGNHDAAISSLLQAIDAKVDDEEAYSSLVMLYLLKGDFKAIKTLKPILEPLRDYQNLYRMLEAHILFHSGHFSLASMIWKEIQKEFTLPQNKILMELIRIYKKVSESAPGDPSANLYLGILYQMTGKPSTAILYYRQSGSYKGIVPYLAESLSCAGIFARRRGIFQEALELMSRFSEVEKKEKWQKLASEMDKFFLDYRFLVQ